MHRFVLAGFLLVPLIVCFMGCGSSSSPGGKSWQTPVLFAAYPDGFQNGQLVSDANDRGLLVWTTNNAQVLASRFDGFTFDAPLRVDDADYVGYLRDIDMNASGDGLLLWHEQLDSGDHGFSARMYSASSGWAANSDPVSDYRNNMNGGACDINAAGDAVLVYGSYDVSTRVMCCRRPSGGSWTTPEQLDSDDEGCGDAKAAIDVLGNVTVVWSQWDGSKAWAMARRYTAASGWDAAVTELDTSGDPDDVENIGLAVNEAGNGLVCWTNDNRDTVYVRRLVGGVWQAVETLATGTNVYWADAKVAPDGRILLVWESAESLYGRACVDGVWDSEATLLSEETPTFDENLRYQVLAMDRANGRCVVMWSRLVDNASDPNSGSAVWARWYDPAEGWSESVDVAVPWTDDIWYDVDDVVLQDDGNVLAVISGEDPEIGYSTFILSYR